MDKLDFLDGDTPSEPAAVLETPAEPIVEGPARGADGKFVSAAAEIEALPPAEPVTVAPVTAEPARQDHVPITALMDERDKRKAAEDRLRQFEAQQQRPEDAPYIDPDVENQLLQQKLNISEELAVDKYGEDLVNEAKAAALAKFQSSPAFQQEVLSHRNPYRYVVEWHKRETALGKIADPAEVDAFLAWKASQAAGQPAPAAAPAAFTPPPVATPPPSLASASSAGGPNIVPTGPGQAYDGLFSKG